MPVAVVSLLLWMACLACAGLGGVAGAGASNVTGRASVVDGDTIEIDGERIQLHGIDAPESAQRCERHRFVSPLAHREAFLHFVERHRCGREASSFLAGEIGQRAVTCERTGVDRDGRATWICQVSGGGSGAGPGGTAQDLGALMVVSGWALADREHGGERYGAEEAEAKRERRGIWTSEFDLPWDWRAGDRSIDADPDPEPDAR